MDGQNFVNDPVVVDATVTPVAETAETVTEATESVIENVTATAETVTESTQTYSDPYQSNNYQDNTASYSDPVYSSDPYNASSTPVSTEPAKAPGVAIASLVLGIAGIVLDCCCGVGLILGIIGLILAIMGNKQQKTGVGTAGLICSIVAIVFGSIYWIYVIAAGALTALESM